MAVNALTAIMATITQTIPKEILSAAFQPELHQETLDQRIIHEVIRPRVLTDTNLMVGRHKKIPLQDAWKEHLDSPLYNVYVGMATDAELYRIPYAAREGREILAVERIAYATGYVAPGNGFPSLLGNPGNTVENLAQFALGSRTLAGQSYTPKAELLTGSLVRIRPRTFNAGLLLECQLEYDPEYTNIPRGMIPPLRELVITAVKTYIYNTLRIKIDANEVINGAPIGVFKEIVEGYRDEDATYNEKLRKVLGAAITADPVTTAKIVAWML